MDNDMMTFFKDTFCNHLKIIKSEIEQNEGRFKSTQMLDDTLDCIRGIKDLHKIKAMEREPSASVSTPVVK